MALCDCGADNSHLITRFEREGRPLPNPVTVCPSCSPGDFSGRFTPDRGFHFMHEVAPNEYEMRDGNLVMKDWAQGELEQRVGKESDDDVRVREAAKERKRQQAREVRTLYGTKLPENVVTQIDNALREGTLAAAAENAGLVLP